MTLRTTAHSLLAALLLLAHTPAVLAAADPDEDEPQEQSDSRWAASLSTDVDQASTRGFAGELRYHATPATDVHFAAETTSYTQTINNGFTSQAVELGAGHEFKWFGIDAAVAHWQALDILAANEFLVGAELHLGPWSIGPRLGYRRSNFNPFDVTVTNATSGTTSSGEATCKLSNDAYGLDGRFQGSVWGAHATFMDFRYSNASCAVNPGTGAPIVTVHQNQTQFAQLVGALVQPMSVAATRYIGRDQTLMDSDLDAGVSWKHNDLVVALGYARQKEYFTGDGSSTYFVTGTADLGNATGIDCTIGITRGDGITESGFVGLAVRAKF
jgi:hypothetical protein